MFLLRNTTKIFIFVNILFLNIPPTLSVCTDKSCSAVKKYKLKGSKLNKTIQKNFNSKINLFDHQIQSINKSSLERILINDGIRLDHFFEILTANGAQPNVNKELSIEIESDMQYRKNDIYYAEGNVIFNLKNGILKTDKFSYDKKTGKVKLIDNISFEKGNQKFKASLIDYDFFLKKGQIKNISGYLSLKNLEKDLNLSQIDKKSCSVRELDLLDLPKELELLNTKNTRLNNIYGLNSDFGSISNWRFKSDKISVSNKSWQSDYIEFTNDPFNQPQFVVESKNFNAEILKNTYKFTSKSTFINFENKLKIPVGNRTISDGDISPKWTFGYDNNWDGLYIYRSSDVFQITNNLDFSFRPYFLLQRAIRGKTSAFRMEDASFIDDKFLQNTSYADYIGLQADIGGEILDWDVNTNFKLRSLNEKRLNDSFSIDANISKTLYSSSNKISKNKCFLDDEFPIEKFSIKSGFYGAYLKDNIYSAYGTKLITKYSLERKNILDDYSLILDTGNYKSGSLNGKSFLSLDRYGINANLNRSYKLFDLNEEELIYESDYNKTPNIIDNAFFLDTKISTSVYQYSNEQSQRILLAGIGPSFTLGNLKKDFLDYSYLSIMPEFIQKKGESPFGFDNFSSDSRIKFVYKQQIYGPILLGLSSDLIISNKSKDYGEFRNIIYSLDVSRRAYKVSLYYKNNNSFGLNFNIFNFDVINFGKDHS